MVESEHQENGLKCLVSTLAKLKESSKDAVVSADFSDAYTMYMHVDRPVQDEFISILKKTYNSPHAELILLCGSVGDGKSHMLSYCKQMYPEMMNSFYVHNDSTASLYIDKPASFTLQELMEDFTDERILSSTKKVILAINLGTLNNFIEGDKDNRFNKFKDYIDKAGILEEKIGTETNEYFHCVNFADYHLFELTINGPKSTYIKGILNKITDQSDENVFYKDYCTCCNTCEMKDKCPIRQNYDLLCRGEVQDGIIRVLIETIIKNKLILSTRALLNFVYELIVDECIFEKGSLEPRKAPDKITTVSYCESLLPNRLFRISESSDVFSAVAKVDPMRIRNEAIDDFCVYYENSSDVLSIFDNDLGGYTNILSRLKRIDFSDTSTHAIKEAVLRLFVRLCWLTGKRGDLLKEDSNYREYMTALYNWNVGDFKNIKEIYSVVEKGVLAWNGPVKKNEMRIPINDKMTGYHLVQEIQIKPQPGEKSGDSPEVLYSFRDEMKLKYKYGNNKDAELEVDYSLYSLLKRVIQGYLPSLIDRRVSVKCVEFIKRISRGGNKMESVKIRNLSHREPIEYVLEYNDSFGYSFEVK